MPVPPPLSVSACTPSPPEPPPRFPAPLPCSLKRLQAAAAGLAPELSVLWQAHGGGQPVAVQTVAHTGSTNSDLLQHARGGLPQPILRVAWQQSAGRGRLGKPWLAEPGSSLCASLAVPLAPADWRGLSLALGVAVAEALDAQAQAAGVCPAPALRLKWPNDLWLARAKLGGILVETASLPPEPGAPAARRAVIVGLGLNVARAPALPESSSAPTAAPALPGVPAAAWCSVCPQADVAAVLQVCAPALLRALLAFEREGFAAFAARFAARDALAGQAVQLSDGRSGTAQGVDAHGALRLLTAQGLCTVDSAEVSLRPVGPVEASC